MPEYSFGYKCYSCRLFSFFCVFFLNLFFLISMILSFEIHQGLFMYNLPCQTGCSRLSYFEELCNICYYRMINRSRYIGGFISIWYSRCGAFAYQRIILNFRGKAKNKSIFPSLYNTFILQALGNKYPLVLVCIFNDR